MADSMSSRTAPLIFVSAIMCVYVATKKTTLNESQFFSPEGLRFMRFFSFSLADLSDPSLPVHGSANLDSCVCCQESGRRFGFDEKMFQAEFWFEMIQKHLDHLFP